MPDELFGKLFGHVRREEAGVRISELRGLLRHRLEHARMLVAETRHRGAARAVEDLAAIGGDEPHPVAASRGRGCLTQAPMQNAALGHESGFSSGTYWES